jgi:hypothetical protein
MLIWIRLFSLMRIRIILPIKVMRSGKIWSIDPLGLHFEPPRLHFERPRPSGFIFEPQKLWNIHSDPPFSSNPDPDPNPASQNNADPDPQPWPKN